MDLVERRIQVTRSLVLSVDSIISTSECVAIHGCELDKRAITWWWSLGLGMNKWTSKLVLGHRRRFSRIQQSFVSYIL